MKKLLLSMAILCLCNMSFAQGRPEFTFSYFRQITKGDAVPANAVTINGYTGTLEESDYVSENPKTAATITKLVKNLRANGTSDINKCFIPRHVISFLKGDSVDLYVLLCFECDGVRFSTQSLTTNVKSIAKREKWMKELKQWFIAKHFNEQYNPEKQKSN